MDMFTFAYNVYFTYMYRGHLYIKIIINKYNILSIRFSSVFIAPYTYIIPVYNLPMLYYKLYVLYTVTQLLYPVVISLLPVIIQAPYI